ncbi:hypothetical protein [Mucilaginibacter sp.]
MSTIQIEPTNKELISTLLDLKKHQPVKTNSWSSADFIKVLWFAHSKGYVKTSKLGYEITSEGESFLDNNSDTNNSSDINNTRVSAFPLQNEREVEKAKAAKDMRKYGMRTIFFGVICYLICHYWVKVF